MSIDAHVNIALRERTDAFITLRHELRKERGAALIEQGKLLQQIGTGWELSAAQEKVKRLAKAEEYVGFAYSALRGKTT